MVAYYAGTDPGPSTGIAVLMVSYMEYKWAVFQVDGNTAPWLIDEIYANFCPRVVAVEEFIPSNRPGTKGKDAQLTRSIADFAVAAAPRISTVRDCPKLHVVTRCAANIKPWATDKRLQKTAFPWGAKFKDARDATGMPCTQQYETERNVIL